MGLAGWLNTAWMLKCGPELWAFHRATRRPAATQAQVLRDILRHNRHTRFGTAHGFDGITDPRAFQARVPLCTYDDLAEAVRRIAAGEPTVLTAEPVELLQPTSGSTGGEKLIPYTATLRRQFQRGVAAWVGDLFRRRPAVRRGRAYWSVSPAFGPARRTAGGIPVGFDDDSAYLGRLERFALERLLVVPAAVAHSRDVLDFRRETLLWLLRADDLTLISVWNPTFLSALVATLIDDTERLCFALRHGTDTVPAAPRRAEQVHGIIREADTLPERLRQIWPRLALISCWADAAAACFVPELRALFPGVEIQPKGLLATEGFVSLPLVDRPAAALALRSHFFEFEEGGSLQEPGRCRLAHELERGGTYCVVLTTGGGLYRYRLRDEVTVVGFEGQCPLLRFRGRPDRVSDLVGEKLAEPHVRSVLDRVFAARRLTPRFALLVPALARPPRYRLYLQGPNADVTPSLLADLQEGLEENPYYRHAVGLGQLATVEAHVLQPDGEPGWRIYERCCLARGQKCGDIKPAALDPWTGWTDEFAAPVSANAGR
jgi:hypothetical protein